MPILSRPLRPLRPAWIAPINPFQQIGQLCRRYRNGRPVLTYRPDELPCLEPFHIQRHADPVMPEQFHQIAFAAPKTKDFATMRVPPETLLHSQCQGIHAAPHVRHSTGNPDCRARRKRNHRGTIRLLSKRAAASMSKSAGIVTRHRSPRLIVSTGVCDAGTGRTPSVDGLFSIGTRRMNCAPHPSIPCLYR